MEIKQLADNFSVTGQITVADVATIKAQGFSAIVCNRPDGEQEGQPLAADIAKECIAQGVSFTHLPMNGPNFSPADVAALKQVLADNANVFGFCRTGNRSSILWNAAQQ